jgi:membrane-associated phospholipid phosphatase
MLVRFPMKLPLFVTKKNKYIAGSLMYGLGYSFYYFTNHYPFLQQHYLPMTWVDLHTPFLPYTVFIYISEYFYFAAVYILLDNYDNINKYLYSFFFMQVVSCTIFMIYPTAYPRGDYPIPTDLPVFVQSTWTWLRSMDGPGNCFPSLHVSSVFLSAFVYWTGNQKKLFWFFIVWATLITLSTLTTKQHYLADIISAILLAVFFFRVFHFKQDYARVYGETNAELEATPTN